MQRKKCFYENLKAKNNVFDFLTYSIYFLFIKHRVRVKKLWNFKHSPKLFQHFWSSNGFQPSSNKNKVKTLVKLTMIQNLGKIFNSSFLHPADSAWSLILMFGEIYCNYINVNCDYIRRYSGVDISVKFRIKSCFPALFKLPVCI